MLNRRINGDQVALIKPQSQPYGGLNTKINKKAPKAARILAFCDKVNRNEKFVVTKQVSAKLITN